LRREINMKLWQRGRISLHPSWGETLCFAGAYKQVGASPEKSSMKVDLRLFAIAIILLAIPVLMALPQSFLVSDVVLSQDNPAYKQAPDEQRRMPLFGKITAIHESSLEIANPNGETVTVKLTPKTEFRKDREATKRSDFKVGDVIVVRGQENPDHTWTAQIIGARSTNGEGRGPNMQAGTLGKDYVTGEVKSIDAPKISVLRSDNVTQTIELNEDTSLRKGREAITMADVQVGDHLIAHGALQDNVFVPKFVMVVGPEQWKRMQEMGGMRPGAVVTFGPGGAPQKPAEPPH
jgi:Domain of unknown function (DUF5666)